MLKLSLVAGWLPQHLACVWPKNKRCTIIHLHLWCYCETNLAKRPLYEDKLSYIGNVRVFRQLGLRKMWNKTRVNVFNSQSWCFEPYVSLYGQKGYVPIVAHTSFPSPQSHTTHVDVDPRQATVNMALVSRPRYRHCFLRRRASPRSTMASRSRERHQEREYFRQLVVL